MISEVGNALPKSSDTTDDQALLAKFAPIVWLHSEELYFPAGVDWFLPRVKMIYNQAAVVNGNIVYSPVPILASVTDSNIDRQSHEDSLYKETVYSAFAPGSTETTEFYLPIQSPSSTYQGMATVSGTTVDLNNPPVYGAAIARADIQATDLLYAFFYAYNGKDMNDVLGVFTHEGDWEHVIVRIDNDQERILGIYFQAHSSQDQYSKWYFPPETGDPDQYVPDGDTRFLVYSALLGHGSYTQSGNHPYNIIRGSDVTDQGTSWDTASNIVVMNSDASGYLDYSGFWGKPSSNLANPPSGPYAQGWFNPRSDGPAEHLEITVNWRKGQTSRVSDNFFLNLPNTKVSWEIAGVSPDYVDGIKFNVSKDVHGGKDYRVITGITNGHITPGKNKHTDNLYLSSLTYTDENGTVHRGKAVFEEIEVESFEVVIDTAPA